MKHVLVTGGKGQLALCIKDAQKNVEGYHFIYVDSDELDITNKQLVFSFFENQKLDFCINCAAYTAVDKAESEFEIAKKINEEGVNYVAEACQKHDVTLIHISTDFVFDGNNSKHYSEDDIPSPLSIYGETKLKGEQALINTGIEKYFIIRTSWLYSEFGNNFLKTMLRLGNEREELSVVCDQIGTPTYAGDLAKTIMHTIESSNDSYGLYHYSNEGVASWYDFAKAIFDENNLEINLLPIKTEAYPTPAKRPAFSVMDKSKIKETLQITIPYWRDSLKKAMNKIKKLTNE